MFLSVAQPVILVLYVSGASPASVRAVTNARRILGMYRSRSVQFTVCDLTRNPEAAERDQIAFTPTLCKRAPDPPMWIVGDLSNADPLLNLLDFLGVPTANGHREAHNRRSGVRHAHPRRHS